MSGAMARTHAIAVPATQQNGAARRYSDRIAVHCDRPHALRQAPAHALCRNRKCVEIGRRALRRDVRHSAPRPGTC